MATLAETESNYSSINVYTTPTFDPQESTELIQSGKPKLKPFLISAVIISLLLCVIIATVIFTRKLDVSQSATDAFVDVDQTDSISTGSACNPYIDCNAHGTCLYDSTGCKCDIGYTTYNAPNGTECNYKQKYQMKAFLLSLFLGEFGAGRYYVGDYVLATVKLLLIFVGCCIACVVMMSGYGADSANLLVCGYCVLFCSAFALGIWVLVDVILFACNKIPDANGVALAPW